MNLQHITCSDPREDVPIKKLTELLEISDLVELGIQAHPSVMSFGLAKYYWLDDMIRISEGLKKPLNIAIHVNYQWCSRFCNGEIPEELMFWFYSKNIYNEQPTIKRWQLNIGDNTQKITQPYYLASIIKNYPDREFIFPYNENKTVQNFVSKLHETGADFSLLFDSSYGIGKLPKSWQSPVYENHSNGYAGGLSPENVYSELDRINNVLPKDYKTWIDAEGKLMKPGTREFDTERAKNYINNALRWINNSKTK